ncbi:MAG TPA: ABC transporter ATP-binding protein [Thermoanaerobaculia bacterium]|nr:ABC transporter ATP-binding protein [Thermoanaerobaculia bacterium]
MSETLVQLREVSKSYRLGRTLIPAATGVTVEISRGDLVALAGPSGSGKSTLLNIIGCIDKPDRGTVKIDSVDVTAVPLHRLAEMRRQSIGFIFQTFNLLPVLTAAENVDYPLRLRGVPGRERRDRVRFWLDRVGLAAFAKHRPDQLSGGQRQRVAIARALAGEPKLVIADEPTANLDSETAARILDLLAEINAATGCTFIFATHDQELISRAARVIRVRDGVVTSDSKTNTHAHLQAAAAL